MKTPVYLDNHATTRTDPRVFAAMEPYFCEVFGNPASRNHVFGWRAADAVTRARQQVAALIGASPREIVFTSGATESNNLAIKGGARAAPEGRTKIVTCATEHKAVLDPCKWLEKQGFELVLLPVDSSGLIGLESLAKTIDERTLLASLMLANNEIGVIQPVAGAARLARERGALFHCDAAQAAGKIPVDVERDQIDLLSLTAHKIYGPKGAGALYVRRRGRRAEIAAQIDGGGHERGLRSGTLNVPGIVGFGAACEIAKEEMEADAARARELRDRLLRLLRESVAGLGVNGSLEQRLPHNLNVNVPGVDGESLLMGLEGIAVSSGSACTTESPEPSHVLEAIGVPAKLARASLRFGIGRFNTVEEIDHAAEKVAEVVRRLRQLTPI